MRPARYRTALLLLAAAAALAGAGAQRCGVPTGVHGPAHGVCRASSSECDGNGFPVGGVASPVGCAEGSTCCAEFSCGGTDMEGERLSRCRTASACASRGGKNTGDHGCGAMGPAADGTAPVCCQHVPDCDERASPGRVGKLVAAANAACTYDNFCTAGTGCDKALRALMAVMHWCGGVASPGSSREMQLLVSERWAACSGGTGRRYVHPGGETRRMTAAEIEAHLDRLERNRFPLPGSAGEGVKPVAARASTSEVASPASFEEAVRSTTTKHSLGVQITLVDELDLLKVTAGAAVSASFGGSSSLAGEIEINGQLGPDYLHVYAGAKASGSVSSKKIGTLGGLVLGAGAAVYRSIQGDAEKDLAKALANAEKVLSNARQSFYERHRSAAMRFERRVDVTYDQYIKGLGDSYDNLIRLVTDGGGPLDGPRNANDGGNGKAPRAWYELDDCLDGQRALARLLMQPTQEMDARFREVTKTLADEVTAWYLSALWNEAKLRFRSLGTAKRFAERIHRYAEDKLLSRDKLIAELHLVLLVSGNGIQVGDDPHSRDKWCPEGAGNEFLRQKMAELRGLLEAAARAASEVRVTPPVALRESGALEALQSELERGLREFDWTAYGPADADVTLKLSVDVKAGLKSDPDKAEGHWFLDDLAARKKKWNAGAFGGKYWAWTAQPFARAFSVAHTSGYGGGLAVGGPVGGVDVQLMVAAHTDGGFAKLSFTWSSSLAAGEFNNKAWVYRQLAVDVAETFAAGYQRAMRGEHSLALLRNAADAVEKVLRQTGQAFGDRVLASIGGLAAGAVGVTGKQTFSVTCSFAINMRGILLQKVDAAFVHGVTASLTDVADVSGRKMLGKLAKFDAKGTYSKATTMTLASVKK